MSAEHERLTYALLLSLLIHTWLMSLIFAARDLGPGMGFPWQDRRIEEPDLRVVVVTAQVASGGAGGVADRGAVAAGIGRAACCQ